MAGSSLDRGALGRGLSLVRDLAGLRARFELWRAEPPVVLDVAHNPDALVPLLGEYRQLAGAGAPVLLAMMEDKEVDPVAAALKEQELTVVPLELDSPRARPAGILGGTLEAHGVRSRPPVDALRIPSLVREGPLLVTGSHQVVEAFLRQMEN